jgi:predicted  nucleic acid-binding Zn-ribbon protein
MVRKTDITKQRKESMSTEIEKKSLEAHVELCAERYNTLAERYSSLQVKIDNLGNEVKTLETHILFIRESLAGTGDKTSKQLIAIGTTIFGVLTAGMITLIVTLFNKV